jgi:uncharacterized protein
MAKQAVMRAKNRQAVTRRPIRSGNGLASPRYKRVSKRQIQWVVDRLVESLEPEKIILFGSYAYGKPNVDSDVDLLIVKDSDERPTILTGNAYRAIWGKTFPMDILVRTPQWIEQRLEIGDSFIQEIVGRGRVIYDRKSHSRVD